MKTRVPTFIPRSNPEDAIRCRGARNIEPFAPDYDACREVASHVLENHLRELTGLEQETCERYRDRIASNDHHTQRMVRLVLTYAHEIK